MAPYLSALEARPQLVPTPLSDTTLQQIQAQLARVQQGNAVLNGSRPADPRSLTVRANHQMTVTELLGATADSLFHQEILDPLSAYIGEWQRGDWGAAIRDTAIGAVVIGATTAGLIFAPEVTVPILTVIGAATTLPGFISAWGDEVANPSDQNLVKASTATGALVLGVGSPIKAFRAVGAARELLTAGLDAKKAITTATEAADLITGSGRFARAQLVSGAPVTRQIPTLSDDPAQLLEQLRSRGIDPDTGSAQSVRAATETLADLKTKLNEARESGDQATMARILGDIQEHAQTTLAPAQLAAASEHVFLPSTPYTHVPLAPVDGVAASTQSKLDAAAGAIRGILREVGHGQQLGITEPQTLSPASIAESQALERAAGTAHYSTASLLSQFEDLKKASGVTDEARVERVLQALEEPEIWDTLRPNEQAFAQKLRDLFDQMSINELRNGTISHILQGRVPRYSLGVGIEGEAASPAVAISRWIANPISNPHRTWKAAVDLEGNIAYSNLKRSELVAKSKTRTGTYQQSFERRDLYASNKRRIDSLRASLGQYRRRGNEAGANQVLQTARQEVGALGVDLVQADRAEIERMLAAKPATTEIAQGSRAVRMAIASHVNRQQMAHYGQALASHANLGMDKLRDILGGTTSEEHWGAALHLPEFRSQSELPDVLPETVFVGDGKINPESAARSLGYYLIHPAIGSPKDFHYRPALYARNTLAKDIIKAGEEASDFGSLQRGTLGALYKIGQASKRVIMATPYWHGFNVAGRAIGYLLSDPALASSSLKLFNEIRKDPEAYHQLVTEFGQAGGVHADKFEVTRTLSQLAREEDGQSRFPGAIRSFGGAISHAFHWQEAGFWRMVDQLQLVAYQSAKHRMRTALPDVPENEIRRAAAVYGNSIGGMVNPLYMSQAWRQMKSMVFFAPSYWATFLRSLESALPGSARLSEFLARRDGGRFVRFSGVPLRAIDYRVRRELTRGQRDFATTYMATTLVAADLMNVIGSGHHSWQNEQGHAWDIDVSNFIPPDQQTGKHTYVVGTPFFRQGADIASALGIGHDWGFGHQFGDETWQQQDAAHKAQMLAGALLDGARRVGAGKTAGPLQAGYGALSGEEFGARFGQGVQRKIDRPAALLELMPSGSAMQRALAESGSPNDPGIAKDAQNIAGSLFGQYTGIPSISQMGSERHPIDDDKMSHWRDTRNQFHDELTKYSGAMLNGQISPREYVRHKQTILDRQAQLNADTFGESSPQGVLQRQRSALQQAYGLNQLGLSDQEWAARYDSFQATWDQMLQAADPATRAAWWDQERAQWTDADYLEWEARQLRDALAASIDGQGGQYIRAYQAQLAAMPYLTTEQRQELEDNDPYYSTYKTLLSNMGVTSALGAFVSAWSSPFSSVTILPPGMTDEQAQAWSQATGKTVIRSETAQQLAQQAKAVAGSAQVRASGGQALTSPQFQQEAQTDIGQSQGYEG